MKIEGITGLKNIEAAFDDRINETDVELLVHYLLKKYKNIYGEDNVYYYITNIIRISTSALGIINANSEEFFNGMTKREALIVVLTKLLEKGSIENYNGFPKQFNFNVENLNTMQTYQNLNWFPCFSENNVTNYVDLFERITNGYEFTGAKYYFHGTSWEGALSICLEGIEIKPRQNCTDFGMRNFYLTDTFKTACLWAYKNIQAAVVFFIIPDDYFKNKLSFNSFNEWKEFVFRVRNKPSPLSSDNPKKVKEEYNRFINLIDSYDLISGPIWANPGVKTIDEINCYKYGRTIPQQLSFKDSTIKDLDSMIMVALFFGQY